MRRNYFFILAVLVLACCRSLSAQEIELPALHHCQTGEAADALYRQHPASKTEKEAYENFTKNYTLPQTAGTPCFVIPVVFHVYGTSQGGYPVNSAIIQGALNMVNNDFHGLNSDYNTVHTQFMGIRSTMPDVVFALAQLDPSGNPTTGIVNHPVTSGFGNGSGYDAQIQADAWDNYMYMNVYVMNDLYNDNVTNNSGVAWYPDSWMTANNLARVVYNGAYLGVNCNSWQPEFASTLTHEFGHWLNLIHTFDGGCSGNNDYVSDTPSCDYFGSSYGCHPSNTSTSPQSCGHLVNAENYMDYSGASGCYKMFTQGQVTRMYAALQHPARITLWQTTNLAATGLSNLCVGTGTAATETPENRVTVFPNPSRGIFTLNISGAGGQKQRVSITDMTGRPVMEKEISAGSSLLDLSAEKPGIYLLRISNEAGTSVVKLVRQ